jgi:hypothetical protein
METTTDKFARETELTAENCMKQVPEEALPSSLIQKLEQLRAHLYGLDSGSGEAELLHEAITELKRREMIGKKTLLEVMAEGGKLGLVIPEREDSEILGDFDEWCASVKDCGHEVHPNSATARQRKLGWDAAMAKKRESVNSKKSVDSCED